MMQEVSNSSSSGLEDFIRQHMVLVVAGVVIGGLLLSRLVNKSGGNSGTGTATTTSPKLVDNSGLTYSFDPTTGTYRQTNGTPVAYIPTSNNYTTNNVGAQFANDPALSSVTVQASNNIIPAPQVRTFQQAPVVPTNSPVITNPAPVPVPPVVAAPTPVSQPPVTPPPSISKTMQWNGTYTVRGGDTLGAIAGMVTNNLRASGAPSSVTVSYDQIYAMNKGTIDSTANAHGNPVPGGPWNNIFPGEVLKIPTWS